MTNLFKGVFILTLTYGLTCCHVIDKMSHENTEVDETAINKLMQRPYIADSNRVNQDTTFKLYHLEQDTLFIGKHYPPEGFKMKFDSSTDFFYQKESNESFTIVKSCFKRNRLEALIQNHSALFLNLYLDQAGIVREVEIRMNDRERNFVSEEEMKCICTNLKGLKITIPPGLSDFPFVKMSQSIWFK